MSGRFAAIVDGLDDPSGTPREALLAELRFATCLAAALCEAEGRDVSPAVIGILRGRRHSRRDRTVSRILHRLRGRRRARPGLRWTGLAAGLAAAGVAIAVAVAQAWAPAASGARLRVVAGTAIDGGGAALAVGDELAAGGACRVPAGGGVVLADGASGARLWLADAARARLEQVDGGWVVELADGTCAAEVEPLASGRAFAVRTAQVEVAVVGTRFRVDASASGTRVAVERGRVVMAGTAGARLEVGAGAAAWCGADGVPRPTGRRPLLLLTDLAAPDDLLAIAYALADPATDLRGIVLCGGHQSRDAALASARTLVRAGVLPSSLPLIEGGDGPAGHRDEAASARIAAAIRAAAGDGPLVVAVLGVPLAGLAAVATDPALAARLIIVAYGTVEGGDLALPRHGLDEDAGAVAALLSAGALLHLAPFAPGDNPLNRADTIAPAFAASAHRALAAALADLDPDRVRGADGIHFDDALLLVAGTDPGAAQRRDALVRAVRDDQTRSALGAARAVTLLEARHALVRDRWLAALGAARATEALSALGW